jgi:hypothetical protein
MVMNLGEFVILLSFLTVLLFVPIAIIHFIGRRRPISKPSLQECPNCSAENHTDKERCYCCGHRLDSSPTAGMNITVLERVKQADEERAQRKSVAKTPETATKEPTGGRNES